MSKDDREPTKHRMITRREAIAASAAAAAVLALGTNGIYGYFTGTGEKRNAVSIAQNLQIRVVEPHWDPENAKGVVPGQAIPKDPQIENLHDKVPGYLFLEIRVPTAIVSLYDPETESVLPPARNELFVYEASDKWILLQEFEDGDEMVRRYAWPDPVPAHGNTDPLFEDIIFASLAEVQGQQGKKKVTATGYGIQSHGFTNPEDAWQAYKLQNGIGDGVPPADPVVGDIVLSTNFIEVGEAYALTMATDDKDETAIGGTVSRATCADAGVVVFESVEIVPGSSYLMLPDMDGASIEDVVKRFEADRETINEFKAAGRLAYEANKTAFAVYSADDKSLRFYRRVNAPRVGDVFNELKVTNVYAGIESDRYTSSTVPWSSVKTLILTARVEDAMAPCSCAYWFYQCANLTSCDLAKLDTSLVTDMAFMFLGCFKLPAVDVSHFDTNKVTSIHGLFANCELLTTLDLSSFSTQNIKSALGTEGVFNGCIQLETIYASSDWTALGTKMFDYAEMLCGGAGTSWSSMHVSGEYARIDDPANGKPGYFTYKAAA